MDKRIKTTMSMNKLFFTIFILIIMTNVTYSQKELHYNYADGNGNWYKVFENSIQYIPVQSNQSSSGVYSGGEPWESKITLNDFKEFEVLFQQAMKDKSSHISERLMGSSLIKKQKMGKAMVCILKPGCSHITVIEEKLNLYKP